MTELGFEIRMRILFATLSGAAGMLAFVCLIIGATGFSLWAVVCGFLMYAATTTRWLVRHT